MTLQRLIADYFREQANWRERKADEYPDDERNRRCATGLRDLARHVDRSPTTTRAYSYSAPAAPTIGPPTRCPCGPPVRKVPG